MQKSCRQSTKITSSLLGGADHSLPDGIMVVGCWAHARRKFDEAMKSLPKGKAKGSSAAQELDYCDRLFAIETEVGRVISG